MSFDKPIGIFDSGVGGLTVMKEIIKKLPNEDIIYFGDTGRVPYGSKSKETIINFSRQISKFLIKNEVKLIVIACNTASSLAYDCLQSEFDIPIVEVITSGVKGAVASSNEIIGVIGTEGTINSCAYEKKIMEYKKNAKVYSKACPLFVPIAEEGNVDEQIIDLVCKMYLNELVEKEIRTLVLGCTHYPLLYTEISRAVGEKVKVINPASITGEVVHDYLKKNHMLNTNKSCGEYKFFTSDMSNKFDDVCKRILGESEELVKILRNRKKINIEDY